MRTKSTPMVEIYAVLKESSANRSIRFDFPTPQSPTTINFKFGSSAMVMMLG